jgi:hypothetical protein
VDDFAQGESNVSLVVAIGDDGESRWMNYQNIQRKVCYKYPYLVHQLLVFSAPTNGMFCKIAQFQFGDGLPNKGHKNLS